MFRNGRRPLHLPRAEGHLEYSGRPSTDSGFPPRPVGSYRVLCIRFRLQEIAEEAILREAECHKPRRDWSGSCETTRSSTCSRHRKHSTTVRITNSGGSRSIDPAVYVCLCYIQRAKQDQEIRILLSIAARLAIQPLHVSPAVPVTRDFKISINDRKGRGRRILTVGF